MTVEKNRNAGTQTEAAYWGMVRSGLRRTFRFWKPIVAARNKARRAYTGENKRQKWEFRCAMCENWHKQSNVEVDHIVPVGSLRCPEDLVGFLERLTAEEGYRVLCKPCHLIITKLEKTKKSLGGIWSDIEYTIEDLRELRKEGVDVENIGLIFTKEYFNNLLPDKKEGEKNARSK